MALEHAPPHLTNCGCEYCQSIQPASNQTKRPETAVVAMTRERKDYFDEDAYETESESEMDRSKKDERIRQAPYLPRVQIWARESGPYTLRVGHQWFHCDDLMINGDEYRQQSRKSTSSQTARSTQSSNVQSGPPVSSPRRPMNRAGSYQRVRADNVHSPRPSNGLVRQASRDKVPGASRYESQSIPNPPRRKHASAKPEDGAKKKPATRVQELGTSPQKTSAVKIPTASSGSLVPYQSSPSNPPPAYPSAKQTRPPARPGRVSRGSSYQIPVRNKSKKNVRFAVPT